LLANIKCELIFAATYQRYDGILWPELVDTGWITLPVFGTIGGKKETPESARHKASFINIKDLKLHDHMKYRKDTLKMYLNILSNIIDGNCRSDPVQFVRTIVAIFLSVHNCCLHYDDKDHNWTLGGEISEVNTSCCTMHMTI